MLGGRWVPRLLPSFFSLCGQPCPPPSHHRQTRGCLCFSPPGKPRALCPAHPWAKSTPPSGAVLCPRVLPLTAGAALWRLLRGHWVVVQVGPGGPRALAPGPTGCSAGEAPCSPRAGMEHCLLALAEASHPLGSLGSCQAFGVGVGGHMGTRGLGQVAWAASGRRSHMAGARRSVGQGKGQWVVVQTHLQEACSRRVLGLGHLTGSAAFGRREPGVRVSMGSA